MSAFHPLRTLRSSVSFIGMMWFSATLVLYVTPMSLSAQASAMPGSSEWLVGSWIPDGESCESDAGVQYKHDGSWTAYGAAGTWTLAEGKIISTVTERWEDGGEPQTPALPGKHAERITDLGPDKYVSHWEDGTVVRLSRCPVFD